jgi:hypothetical protein
MDSALRAGAAEKTSAIAENTAVPVRPRKKTENF